MGQQFLPTAIKSCLQAYGRFGLAHEDEALTVACQRSLSESLFTASQWGGLRSPPSEIIHDLARLDEPSVWEADVSSSEWLPRHPSREIVGGHEAVVPNYKQGNIAQLKVMIDDHSAELNYLWLG